MVDLKLTEDEYDMIRELISFMYCVGEPSERPEGLMEFENKVIRAYEKSLTNK